MLIQSAGEVRISFIGPSPHGIMTASALETGPGFHSACGYHTQTQGLLLIQNPSAEWTEGNVHEWLAQDHDANCHSRESNPGLSNESPTLY